MDLPFRAAGPFVFTPRAHREIESNAGAIHHGTATSLRYSLRQSNMGFGEFAMLSSLASAVLRSLVAGSPVSPDTAQPRTIEQPAALPATQRRDLPAFTSISTGGWSGAGYMPAAEASEAEIQEGVAPRQERAAQDQDEAAARDRARIADWLGTMRTGAENSPLSFLRPEKAETPAYRHAVNAYGEYANPTGKDDA